MRIDLILFSVFSTILQPLTLGAIHHTIKLPIGAIFEFPNNELEIALRVALETSNINDRHYELIPIIKYSKSDDSYTLEAIACELIAEGVVAIFGSPSPTSGIVSAICHTLEIPHILYDYRRELQTNELQFQSMTINVHPYDLKLATGYAAVVQSLSWDRYGIIYDTQIELVQLQDILQIHSPNSRSVVIRQLPDGPDFRSFLKNLNEMKIPCLLIHCDVDDIFDILQQANDLQMLGEYQSIFLASLDAHTINLESLNLLKANITTIRLMDPTDFYLKNTIYAWKEYAKRFGNYLKISPEEVKINMLLVNDAVLVFTKALSKLNIADIITIPELNCYRSERWEFGRQIMNEIKSSREEGTTGLLTFDEFGHRDIFNMRILELSSSKEYNELAKWDPVEGIVDSENENEIQKRRDQLLTTKVFLVSSRIGEPFLFNRSHHTNETLYGNDRYEGYSMDLIDAIAKLNGFKYEFVLAPDGKYGAYVKETGKWNGIVREVMDGNVDMGICDLTMTAARREVVDFTPPFMTLGISLMYAQPAQIKSNLFSFIDPFSTEVWMKMGISFAGLILLIFIAARMAPADWENPHPCDPDPEVVENIWNIKNSVWLTIGSLMGQGCDILPKSASVRIITGMWWFFALMMLNSYTANLAAFLTTSSTTATINSVDELAQQNKVKYGVLDGGSTMGFFRDSNESIYQKMWSVMESEEPSVFTASNDIGEERVVKSKRQYAFFMESSVLEYKIERNCELIQIGSWLDYKTYGIAMPFNSRFRKEISEAILKLGESGVLADLKRKWWKEMHGGGKCSVASVKVNSGPVPLAIKNVGGVFLLLGMGILCGCIVAIVEFFWNLQAVSMEEKVTLAEAFKLEALFALKFWEKTKPVRVKSGNGSNSNSDSLSSSKSFQANAIDSKSSQTIRKLHGSQISIPSIKLSKVNVNSEIKSRASSCSNLKSQLNLPVPL